VSLIMMSYALFAFLLLNGLLALFLMWQGRGSSVQVGLLTDLSKLLLYPALACLAVGIFLGAVWANVSWGRYWGWDPKEVWALITMLVYSLALHGQSLKWFRSQKHFHLFMVLAFLTVLMTYFGVNYILGGMHSYAG
jgi:ABC-type transport system involved in cytochrome c biogenesis permease subunit